ncbi:MAG: hypothetical protein HY690_08200 [Chloroflexi bacterium]|nr:hypothetical protein [Chloroflexota bacterium]
MAQVVQDPETSRRIEGFLSYALQEWASVPEYAARFDAWDPMVQLDFIHEWAIRESALEVLGNYAAQDRLTTYQCARYEELLRLVEQQRPVIERILAEP